MKHHPRDSSNRPIGSRQLWFIQPLINNLDTPSRITDRLQGIPLASQEAVGTCVVRKTDVEEGDVG